MIMEATEQTMKQTFISSRDKGLIKAKRNPISMKETRPQQQQILKTTIKIGLYSYMILPFLKLNLLTEKKRCLFAEILKILFIVNSGNLLLKTKKPTPNKLKIHQKFLENFLLAKFA